MISAFIAAAMVASISLIGIIVTGAHGRLIGSHRFVIPVAIGVFLGVVFFELIPETIEAAHVYGPVAIVVGFLSFYLLSHLLKTYHHHHHDPDDDCTKHQGASLLVIGDTIHNIADGVVIASAFLINPAVGIAATIGVALHEIPQEIAEFGVLVQAGYTKRHALTLNVLSASSIFIGVTLSFLLSLTGDFLWVLTGVAAGNLLYIAASDMIPELNHRRHASHFPQTFLSTLVGVGLIFILFSFTHT